MDGLRLLCALAVAGYHYSCGWRVDGTHPPAYFLPTASHVLIYGFLGVELFFMISGFVICMSGWGRTPGEFFASRVTRLYPAFWAAVAITTLVVAALPVTTGVPVSGQPSLLGFAVNLTMVPQQLGTPMVDTVYWTLWVELRFYLLFSLLCWRGLTYRSVVTFCVGWMAAVLLAPGLGGGPWVETLVMPDFAPYFIAGMAMYVMRRDRPTALLWGIVGFCWLVSLQRVHDRVADVHPGFPVPEWPASVIITLAFAALLAIALGATDRITWRWLGTAGALTYPFYLLHQRIGYSVMRAAYTTTGLPAWVLIAGAVAFVLILAWLVHRFAERPLARMMRTALRRPPGPVSPAATPVPPPRPALSLQASGRGSS